MSELISGKEALIALANGEKIQWRTVDFPNWVDLDTWNANIKNFLNTDCIRDGGFEYRLKPRTITINGIEVPAPFEPKVGERFYYFSDEYTTGYASSDGSGFYGDMSLGTWRTEDEIKQVVAALRNIFVINNQ